MVKIILKSIISRHIRTKRVRGLRFRVISNRHRRNQRRRPRRIVKKRFNMNYYLKPKINFLLSQEEEIFNTLRRSENYEFSEHIAVNNDVYKKKDRELAIIGLKDMACQIIASNPHIKKIIPDYFIPSAIALLDYYLKHTKKQLTQSTLIKALYSAVIYIDQEKGLGIFNKSFLNNFVLNKELFEVVNATLYPVKVYDYFEIFYLRISQKNKHDKNHKKYIKKFKKVFLEFDFYLSFNENYRKFRPYQNFISCLLMTRNFIQNNDFLTNEIVDNDIEYFRSKIEYNKYVYDSCCYLIKESKYIYDNYMNVINVNNLCKNGILTLNNMNSIE